MDLLDQPTIAGAVAREVARIVKTGEHHGEGSAYKGAWDRKGSRWEKHCDALLSDVHVSARPQRMRLAYVMLEGVKA